MRKSTDVKYIALELASRLRSMASAFFTYNVVYIYEMSSENEVVLEPPSTLLYVGMIVDKGASSKNYFAFQPGGAEIEVRKATLYYTDTWSTRLGDDFERALREFLGSDKLPVIEFNDDPRTAIPLAPVDIPSALYLIVNREKVLNLARRLGAPEKLLVEVGDVVERVLRSEIRRREPGPGYLPHVLRLKTYLANDVLPAVEIYRIEYGDSVDEDDYRYEDFVEFRLGPRKEVALYYRLSDLDEYAESLANVMEAFKVPVEDLYEELGRVEKMLMKAGLLIEVFNRIIRI